MPDTRIAATLGIVIVVWAAMLSTNAPAADPPNILVILADDRGFGDVGCYNPKSKIPTPHLDQLAEQGMRFTDAHSPATVCTPTRYSLLTGRQCFRTGYRGVFTGVGGPCLIKPGRPTVASVLKQQGYATAMFGKWHIGLTFLDKNGERVQQGGVGGVRAVDFSKAIPDGPLAHGFDEFYGTACCPTTDWLYAYIDGDRVPVPPALNQVRDRGKLPKHPYANDCRPGLVAPNFDLEEVDLVFLQKSREFLQRHVKNHPQQPFFLLHSMQAVHLPSFAAKQFQGKSGAGPHGDFIVEMDWIVGQLLATLENLGVADNTLVVFCSDNGPEVPTVRAMRRDHQHDGARPWRGVKRDNWEGGHRTPFVVRWPERVEADSVCDQMLSLTPLFATFSAVSGAHVPAGAAEDSFNMLPVLLGKSGDTPVREYLLQQTMSGKHLSLRRGPWKYLNHQGSGGSRYDVDSEWGMLPYALPDTDPDAPGQLYHLGDDPGETQNLYSKHPKIVAELSRKLDEFVSSGRCTPQQDGER